MQAHKCLRNNSSDRNAKLMMENFKANKVDKQRSINMTEIFFFLKNAICPTH